jgi:hypothetical protein
VISAASAVSWADMLLPRRRFAAGFLFGMLSLGVAAAGGCAQSGSGDNPNATGCDSPYTTCGAACVDLKTDPTNCGGCGKTCNGAETCSAGKCGLTCPPRESVCTGDAGSICVDTKADNANCGMCGKACSPDEVCASGACASACAATQTKCTPEAGAPFCANVKTDQANCGGCGVACSPAQACVAGTCSSSCTASQTLCTPEAGAAYCADTNTDNANCGACGTPCGVLQVCSSGMCTSECAPSQTLCGADGGAPFCASTLTDTANCGSCGNVCPMTNPVCAGGTCLAGGCNRTVLVLGDGVAASESAYQTMLQAVGFAVTLVSNGTVTWAGSPSAAGFGVVIVTPGNSYASDMPLAGQQNVLAAVNSGATGLIETEWVAYELTTSHYQTYAPLVLFTRASGTTMTLTFTLTQAGHPIWNGLPNSFTTSLSLGANISGTLQNGAVQIAGCTQCGTVGVAARDGANGRIVQIAHAAGYLSEAWYNDANLKLMMTNSVQWAARCD